MDPHHATFARVTDKRRSHRISVDLPTRFRSETESVDGRAANLSSGGIRFVGAGGIERGHVVIEIDLPDDEKPLHLHGEVCWSQAGSRALGIRFVRVGKNERRRLANFVIRRACESMG